jgi:uncharacterized membrane protein YfcA
MPLEPMTFAAVALLAAAAAVIGGVGGFGTGIILTAALVPLIGPKATVPVLAVAGILINAGRFWFYRKSVNLRAVAFVCAGALPALLAGTWIFAVLDARSLGIVLALFVLGSIPLRRILKQRALTLGPRGLVAGAGVFGLASGFASGTGVILISLLLGAGFGGTMVLATDALITIIIDVIRAGLYGRFDLLDARYATLGAAIGIVTVPGSWLAAFLVQRMGAHLHTLAIEALIGVGGMVMLWHALR